MSGHEMRYRAGIGPGFGIPPSGPHWWCTCQRWAFNAVSMPHRKTGNNRVEADRSFAAHVAAA